MFTDVKYTACADYPNVVAECHIFGGAHPEEL